MDTRLSDLEQLVSEIKKKEGCWREATSQEVSEFFAKVRKTQKIINY